VAVVSALRDYLKRIKRFRLENFSAKLDESSREALQEAALAPFLGDLLPAQLEEEFGFAVKSVKLVRLQKERKDLVAQIREMEKAQDAPGIRRRQKELLKLNEKIEAIQINRGNT
jgi:hypothetical protein